MDTPNRKRGFVSRMLLSAASLIGFGQRLPTTLDEPKIESGNKVAKLEKPYSPARYIPRRNAHLEFPKTCDRRTPEQQDKAKAYFPGKFTWSEMQDNIAWVRANSGIKLKSFLFRKVRNSVHKAV